MDKKQMRRELRKWILKQARKEMLRDIRSRKKDRYLDKPFRRRGDIPTSDGFEKVTKIPPS